MTAWMLLAACVAAGQPEDPRPMCLDLRDPRKVEAGAADIMLDVDATDLARNLVRSRMTIRAQPGPLALWYVLWTPGNHTPSGPIENVVDLFVCDCLGNPLDWRRDPMNVNRITLEVPQGCDHIGVSMGYIAGQPNTNSRSTDTYGRAWGGALNWNTVLWYPAADGAEALDLSVEATLRVPEGWTTATSLEPEPGRPGAFARSPLVELVDSPVLMGVHLTRTELDVPGAPLHEVFAAAAEPELAGVSDFLRERLEAMVGESLAVFGAFPFERYRFLLLAGDGLGGAVEHARSTFTTLPAGALRDAKPDPLRGGAHHLGVLPHEYFHVWCGKMSRPAGLATRSYHEHPDTSLLWVYEGLTSYYDDVLAVRSGMMTPAEWREVLVDAVTLYEQRTGRLWRSIEDTALAARHLRQRGVSWYDLRQGQEYYGQAALFWLEADAIIRRGTGGTKSLDDFARAMFDVARFRAANESEGGELDSTWSPLTYTREDLVRALAAVYAGQDWDALIRERIQTPARTLDMGAMLERVGLKLEWSAEPSEIQRRRTGLDDDGNPKPGGATNLRTSLGFTVDAGGVVTEIVPNGPADLAGLAFTSRIVSVNGQTFSGERLKDAVRASRTSGKVELLVDFGGSVTPMTIRYDGGLRYGRLMPIEGAPDLVGEIVRPRGGPERRNAVQSQGDGNQR